MGFNAHPVGSLPNYIRSAKILFSRKVTTEVPGAHEFRGTLLNPLHVKHVGLVK